MPISCVKIADMMAKYHPYTVAYRAPESELYKDFTPFDPQEIESYHSYAANLDWQGDRPGLARALTNYLKNLDAPQAALNNAACFADNKTVAVVAGHQPNLFGGPLFLILKIISALNLCQQLNERELSFSEAERYKYVPIFWNASVDHNRDEFGRVTIFDPEHDLIHLAIPGNTSSNPSRKSAAETDSSEAEDLLNKLFELLPDTEFKAAVFENLRANLIGNLGESMSRLILSWFGEAGLVVLEPHILQPFAKPCLEKALKEWKEIHKLLDNDRQSMEDRGYPPPLMLREADTTLVYHRNENGERSRLRVDSTGYKYTLNQKNIHFESESIFNQLHKHPERFSPSAALRPMVQAWTLPVAAYIAGGGELAYHCQIRSLFQFFGVKAPILLPRTAGTIIKNSLVKTLHKLGVSPEKLISDRWEWDTILKGAKEKNSLQGKSFAEFKAKTTDAFKILAEELGNSGLNNLNELERTRQKFYDNLEGLKRRYEQQDPVFGKDARRRYFRLRKFVLPGERYQDICIWTVYFLCCFGMDILPEIMAKVNPLSLEHHLFIIK